MTTFHQQAAQGVLDKYLEDPERAKVFAEARTDIRSGRRFFRSELEDVGQIHRIPHPGDWPLEQMACFLDVHVMRGAGSLVRFRIDVGAGPMPDAARAENAGLLAARPDAEADAFEIWVDQEQYKADSDGALTLVREVEFTRSSGLYFWEGAGLCRSGPCARTVEMPVVLRPVTVPLEIGTTVPSRTWAHIVREGGVARWPYGHEYLTVFLNLGRTVGPRRHRVCHEMESAGASQDSARGQSCAVITSTGCGPAG